MITNATAATASAVSAALTNYNAKGVALMVNVTTGSASGTVGTIQIQAMVASGTYMTIYTFAGAITTGSGGYLIYPGASSAGSWTIAPVQGIIPRDWRVVAIHGFATSTISYTITACYIT